MSKHEFNEDGYCSVCDRHRHENEGCDERIDYRELLKKYMEYVRSCEGVNFIGDTFRSSDWKPSEDEWEELEAIDEELEREYEESKP